MKEKEMNTIKINGEEYVIKYTIRALFMWEQITGKPFSDINTDSSKDNFALAYAAIIAKNPDTIITVGNLIHDASGAELNAVIKAISDSFVEWNNVPATLADEEDKKKDEPEEGHSYGDPECADDSKNF